MAQSDYTLNLATSNTIADSAEVNANLNDIEDTNVAGFGAGVISGAVVTDGGGLNANVSAAVFLLGVKLSKAAAVVALNPSTTNRIWAVTDPDNAERVVYQVTTTAVTLARACIIAEVDTSASAITAIRMTTTAGRGGVVANTAIVAAVPTCTIAVGAEASNVKPVSVQFKDLAGVDLGARVGALMWLADAANAGETATAPNGGWTAGVGYKLTDMVAGKSAVFVSDAAGLARVNITHTATGTWYLHALVGSRVYVSGAITFT